MDRQNVLSPAQSEPKGFEGRLNITVVFTSVDPTLAALKEASRLADRLGGRIELIVAQVVPYPLPLASPPVPRDWSECRFRVLAAKSPVETKVLVYLCRDRTEALISKLRPESVVVLGGHKRLWTTSEARLARRLRMAGHQVILKETE